MTGTGSSEMKRLRLSGSATEETCSAETTVPWITRMSRPASSATSTWSVTRWGVSDPAATTPWPLISAMRWAISSGLTGSR